jgi:hypothetical protein
VTKKCWEKTRHEVKQLLDVVESGGVVGHKMLKNHGGFLILTEITQPCVHTCDSLFICQLYSLHDLLEEMDCKEDTPLTLPFCIIRFFLTVDNSDMN